MAQEIMGGQHVITAGRCFSDQGHQRTNATSFFAGQGDPSAVAMMAKSVQDQPARRDTNDGYSEAAANDQTQG